MIIIITIIMCFRHNSMEVKEVYITNHTETVSSLLWTVFHPSEVMQDLKIKT
jgi:hypothetical protein